MPARTSTHRCISMRMIEQPRHVVVDLATEVDELHGASGTSVARPPLHARSDHGLVTVPRFATWTQGFPAPRGLRLRRPPIPTPRRRCAPRLPHVGLGHLRISVLSPALGCHDRQLASR
jgi:hypothetical protein